MKFKNILLTLTVIFILAGLFIYIEPSITGFVIQDKFLIKDVKVSAPEFDQEIKVEQFDEHEIKFDNALYYFTIKPEYKQEINYLEVEFIVDSAQIRDYDKQDIGLYSHEDGWLALDTEFIKQDGRFLYYKGKSEKFGLFTVAPKEKELIIPSATKNDLIFFALIPLFAILLLFIVFSYGSVRLIQKLNYRIYLLLKKSFVVLVKFGLSLGIVILILDLISVDKQGSVEGFSLIYYAIIPLLILSLLSNVVLNLVLRLHKLIKVSRVYRVFRNSFWLFVFVLIGVSGLLYKSIPGIEGELSNAEILIYGLIPLVVISIGFVFVFVMFYVLVRKLFVKKVFR